MAAWPCILCLCFCSWPCLSGCCRLCHHACPLLPLFPHPTDTWGGGVAPTWRTPRFSARQRLMGRAEFRIQRNSSLLQEVVAAELRGGEALPFSLSGRRTVASLNINFWQHWLISDLSGSCKAGVPAFQCAEVLLWLASCKGFHVDFSLLASIYCSQVKIWPSLGGKKSQGTGSMLVSAAENWAVVRPQDMAYRQRPAR